ncbi:MAG: hypothetical protein ACKO96_36730, partial [Flammeovirgaceae bacterium]
EIVYPEHGAKVFIPKELDGQPGRLVLQALARNGHSTIYWHIDGEFKRATRHDHKWSVFLSQGRHNITIMDENGAFTERFFEVLSK